MRYRGAFHLCFKEKGKEIHQATFEMLVFFSAATAPNHQEATVRGGRRDEPVCVCLCVRNDMNVRVCVCSFKAAGPERDKVPTFQMKYRQTSSVSHLFKQMLFLFYYTRSAERDKNPLFSSNQTK